MVRVNEFELHGVISTESKLSESEFFEKFFKMLEDNEMSFGGSFYMMDDNGNYTSDLTFCDLFFYIQSAERDSVGKCIARKGCLRMLFIFTAISIR